VQAGSSGKPAAVINKMVEGRLGKFFEECVLLEQRFIADDSVKVKQVVDRYERVQSCTTVCNSSAYLSELLLSFQLE